MLLAIFLREMTEQKPLECFSNPPRPLGCGCMACAPQDYANGSLAQNNNLSPQGRIHRYTPAEWNDYCRGKLRKIRHYSDAPYSFWLGADVPRVAWSQTDDV